GALVGVASIPLIARAHDVAGAVAGRSGMIEAIGAGVAFAIFFIVLDTTPDESGVVPRVAGRLTPVPLFSGLAAMGVGTLALPRNARGATIGSGFLDMAANGLFLAATRQGFLALVAVLTSLYPAVTILLARFVLHERVGRIQGAGLGLAGIGVVLMAAG
ncbi:MAG: EamA family transporter, partial [Acidimicrobiia bacterium]